jgi:type I restriction enzyme M protein
MARKPRQAKAKSPQTTAQRLDSIVKSARRIMRKDKGLSGELDRLPMLTWLLFGEVPRQLLSASGRIRRS